MSPTAASLTVSGKPPPTDHYCGKEAACPTLPPAPPAADTPVVARIQPPPVPQKDLALSSVSRPLAATSVPTISATPVPVIALTPSPYCSASGRGGGVSGSTHVQSAPIRLTPAPVGCTVSSGRGVVAGPPAKILPHPQPSSPPSPVSPSPPSFQQLSPPTAVTLPFSKSNSGATPAAAQPPPLLAPLPLPAATLPLPTVTAVARVAAAGGVASLASPLPPVVLPTPVLAMPAPVLPLALPPARLPLPVKLAAEIPVLHDSSSASVVPTASPPPSVSSASAPTTSAAAAAAPASASLFPVALAPPPLPRLRGGQHYRGNGSRGTASFCADANTNSENMAVVKAVLCAGQRTREQLRSRACENAAQWQQRIAARVLFCDHGLHRF